VLNQIGALTAFAVAVFTCCAERCFHLLCWALFSLAVLGAAFTCCAGRCFHLLCLRSLRSLCRCCCRCWWVCCQEPVQAEGKWHLLSKCYFGTSLDVVLLWHLTKCTVTLWHLTKCYFGTSLDVVSWAVRCFMAHGYLPKATD
jgi:hypothetical protein